MALQLRERKSQIFSGGGVRACGTFSGLTRGLSRNSPARNLHQRAVAADRWREGREELAGFRGGGDGGMRASGRVSVNEHFVFSFPIFGHAQLANQTHYLLPAAAACDACDPASRTRTRCNAGASVRPSSDWLIPVVSQRRREMVPNLFLPYKTVDMS